MSDRGIRENDLINRLKAADQKIADQAATITTLQGQVPDGVDNAVDARATAILEGQPDPGDPLASPATPPVAPAVVPPAAQ